MKGLRWGVVVAPLFFILFYLLPLNLQHLWSPDEIRYAEISREMLASGNWVVPHFLDLRYFEKPIAGYWFNSFSQLLFGNTNFAVRFASAIATFLSAILLYWFAMRLWRSQAKAIWASFIYLSFLLVYGIGTYSVLDAMVTFWLNASMVCCYFAFSSPTQRNKILCYLALGVVCGMGFLTKGFLALAVPVITVIPYMLYRRRFFELLCYGPLAIISAAVVAGPWAWAIYQREPDYWHYFFWIEHIQRFAEKNAQHKSPVWFYLPLVLLGSLPWVGLLFSSLKTSWQQRKSVPEYLYLLAWFVIPLCFFSIAKGKLLTYILPCFAPLALLLASCTWDSLKKNRLETLKLNAYLNGIFGLVCIATLCVVGFSTKYTIFAHDEYGKVLLGICCFSIWSLLGFYQLGALNRRFWLNGLLPPLLAITLVWALPRSVTDSKLLVPFLTKNNALLANSTSLLSDDVAAGSAVAWVLHRTDIVLLSHPGELQYGLSYPDAQHRFIQLDQAKNWIAQARNKGNVSVILKDIDAAEKATLPTPTKEVNNSRITIFYYSQEK